MIGSKQEEIIEKTIRKTINKNEFNKFEFAKETSHEN